MVLKQAAEVKIKRQLQEEEAKLRAAQEPDKKNKTPKKKKIGGQQAINIANLNTTEQVYGQ
jgi:hypothetical protein